MLIDLKNIPAYYINLPQHTEKKNKVETTLKSLNIFNIQRLEGFPYPHNPVAGCSRAHYHALNDRVLPFLLLEDDVIINESVWNDGFIEVPDDADAIYLGTSTWGRMNGHNGEYVQYDILKEFPGVLKVYNMLATHAILYLTEDYRNIIKRAAYYTGYKIENYNDVAFAELQRFFNVYALDIPLFSQTSNYNATNKRITEINHTECMSLNSLQFYPYPLK